jgi:hypothetical protein
LNKQKHQEDSVPPKWSVLGQITKFSAALWRGQEKKKYTEILRKDQI